MVSRIILQDSGINGRNPEDEEVEFLPFSIDNGKCCERNPLSCHLPRELFTPFWHCSYVFGNNLIVFKGCHRDSL